MTDRVSLGQGSGGCFRHSRMGAHMRFPRNSSAIVTACLLAGACALFAETRVVVENEAVRILAATQAPGEKTPLHRHAGNRVVVFLDSGDLRVFDEQGHAKDEHWSAGQTVWSGPTGMHITQNSGATPLRIVEIEIKRAAPEKPTVRRLEYDPVAMDPKRNALVFENDYVRVFKSWLEPGATAPMYEHVGTGRAVVLLTDLDVSEKLADGTVSRKRGHAGDIFWSGPVTHADTNLAKTRLEMVVVEVK
jgi:mannose-6-phosphate isomerase-like protein (cupin superfamily)